MAVKRTVDEESEDVATGRLRGREGERIGEEENDYWATFESFWV